MVEVRRYEPARDEASAFALWQRSLGRTWPLERSTFAAMSDDALVASAPDRIAGVAALAHEDDRGSLRLLLVDPELRGRGVGRRLHDAALAGLARQGVRSVSLGGTPDPYVWPGLPADLADARTLFERWGWTFGYTCWDLVRHLADYETPADVARRGAGFTCRWATGADRAPLDAFEQLHFPEWAAYFQDEALETAVLAADAGGEIVGSLQATDHGHPQLWHGLLGETSGAIGAVGVAEAARGRGIGTALVAYACEQLRERGVGNCHIGWTTELSFYGRLGFRPWREYETAGRELDPRLTP